MLLVEGLTTHYGRIRAIREVSLRVKEGEIVTLIGSNGAGKSTTLMTISGALKASAGSVTFFGEKVTGLRPHELVRMGIVQVPEGRRVLPHMSVSENLDLGGFTRSAGEREETLQKVFALFPRLAERRAQPGGTLSGGEQQMLAIGRAMMARPRILLLDEPSLGLAPKIIDRIFEIIQELNATGTTVLLVEQNAAMALEIAHRGYVLESGQVVIEGDAPSLRSDPKVAQAYLGI